MKVYKVKIQCDYDDYYVTANSFNEAEQKAINKKIKKIEEGEISILTNDGSLNPQFTKNTEKNIFIVNTIEMLTEIT